MAPALCPDSAGAWLSWLEPAPVHATATSDDVWRLRVSHLNASRSSWSPAITVTQRRNFFVNWADTPQIAVAGDGALIVTWLQQSGPGTYAYDIGVARSTDRGATWTMLGTLNDDRTETEHGFVSMIPEGDGVRAIWLDGRAMTGDGHAGEGGGDMALRTALITDHVGVSSILDPRTCECCPTALVRVGESACALYRDRGASERRDMSVVRLSEGVWSSPTDVHRDNWIIAGCPVNGPAAAADGDRVAAAWTSGGARPGVRVALSSDGGRSFTAPIHVGTPQALGRPDICWHEGHAWVCWLDDAGEAPVLRWTRLADDGTPVKIRDLAGVSAGRQSGFPALAPVGKAVLAIWTSEDPTQGLSAAVLRHSLADP
jgi:hypothetical protein